VQRELVMELVTEPRSRGVKRCECPQDQTATMFGYASTTRHRSGPARAAGKGFGAAKAPPTPKQQRSRQQPVPQQIKWESLVSSFNWAPLAGASDGGTRHKQPSPLEPFVGAVELQDVPGACDGCANRLVNGPRII
jgi:hypothetical protein